MYHTFSLISISNLAVFNMTMVDIPTKMSDMFDGIQIPVSTLVTS